MIVGALHDEAQAMELDLAQLRQWQKVHRTGGMKLGRGLSVLFHDSTAIRLEESGLSSEQEGLLVGLEKIWRKV